MKDILVHLSVTYFVLAFSKILESHGAVSDLECSKPWTIPKIENGTEKCACGSGLQGMVKCDLDSCKISVMYCYCMTYSDTLNMTVVGYCLNGYDDTTYKTIHACSAPELNSAMCKDLHRTGQMCGNCEKAMLHQPIPMTWPA